MKRPSRAAISVVLLATVMSLAQEKQASEPVDSTGVTQDSAEPPDHGAYYKAKDGWQELELLTSAGQDVHVNAFTMHGGAKQQYRGTEAPVQLSDRRPVFYIKMTQGEAKMAEYRGPNAARNTVIVLLSKKGDHRELQTVKSGLTGAKAGLDKKVLPDVTLHSINNLTITITPNRDLAPGEYLLTWSSMGQSGYDFGIK
jgi:hypothetical protein